MSVAVKVFLVDDHKMVRAGLRTLLHDDARVRVVGEAGSKAETLERLLSAAPDVILMDVRLPDGMGYDLCGRIKELAPRSKVLVLTSFGDDELVLQAIAAGADGYLLKEIEGPDLANAIIAVQTSGSIFAPSIARAALTAGQNVRRQETLRRYELLTPQEKRVLALVSKGRTNKEIGDEMSLGEKTVRNYLSSILAKLGFSRRTEAATWYVREIDQAPE